MRAGDLVVGGGEAWRIVERGDEGRTIKVRLAAGKGVDVRTSEVPASFFDGRTLYRPSSEIGDIDEKLAVAEVSRYVEIDALGSNPRLWVEAFHERYKPGHPVPDAPTLLGWFARLIDSGYDKKVRELEEARLDRRAAVRKPRSRSRARQKLLPPPTRKRRK